MRTIVEGIGFWVALVLGIAIAETRKTERKPKRQKMKHYVHNHNSDYGC